jgi:hypothetical protein
MIGRFAFDIVTAAVSGTPANIESVEISGDGGFVTQTITLPFGTHDVNRLIEDIPRNRHS